MTVVKASDRPPGSYDDQVEDRFREVGTHLASAHLDASTRCGTESTDNLADVYG
jgi:hypothetical protein